tara:strand:+ start:113 stop:781 length:669 start_codon:yes stop_codon:yes gene_type:complete
MKIKYSIIVPVYNCQYIIEKLTIKIIKEIKLYSYSFEIILVDDNSQDKSWDILKNLRDRSKKIKIFKNKKNIGQHLTVIKGLSRSKGENIFIIDGDLEDDPKNFKKFIKKKDNKTCLFGLVSSDNNKGYISYFFWTIFSYLTKINKNYRSTTFCLIPRSSAMKLLKLKNIGFIYAELYKLNENIEFVVYKKNKKSRIKKGYNYLKLILFGLKILFIYIFVKR